MEKVKENLFDKFYEMSEDDFAKEAKGSKRNELQRMFEMSYDNAFDEIVSIKKRMRGMTENCFRTFDLNEYRKAKSEIKEYSNAMKEIEELHVEFFGEALRNKR